MGLFLEQDQDWNLDRNKTSIWHPGTRNYSIQRQRLLVNRERGKEVGNPEKE